MGGRLSFTYLWGLFFFFLNHVHTLSVIEKEILPFQKPRHLCITLTAVVYLVFQKPRYLCIALTAVLYLVSNYSELLLKHTNLLAPIMSFLQLPSLKILWGSRKSFKDSLSLDRVHWRVLLLP